MSYLVWLVPIALGMGVAGLAAFLWSMRAGQYEDLDGAAERVLLADAAAAPLCLNTWADKTPKRPVSEKADLERSGRNSHDGVR